MSTTTTTVTSAHESGVTTTETTTVAHPSTAAVGGSETYPGSPCSIGLNLVIDAPASKVVPLVKFGEGVLPEEGPMAAVLKCTITQGDGASANSVRTIDGIGGDMVGKQITERCIGVWENGYSYHLVYPGSGDPKWPFPFALHGYRGTFSVNAIDDKKCMIVWSATFHTDNVAVASETIKGMLPGILAGYEMVATKGSYETIGDELNSPFKLADVSLEWLQKALAPHLTKSIASFSLGAVGEVAGVAAESMRCKLVYEDGSDTGNDAPLTPTNPPSIFIKVPSPVIEIADGLMGPYGFYLKEVKFYQNLADKIREHLDVPKMIFGAIEDTPVPWRFVLILADLAEFNATCGSDLDGATLEETMKINDALVKMQIKMHVDPCMSEEWLKPPIKYVQDVGSGLAACTPAFEEVLLRKPSSVPLEFPPEVFEILNMFKQDGVGGKISQYTIDVLGASPFTTLMRLDNRLENTLFNDEGRVWAVDWQIAAQWSPALDLAWWLNFSTNLEVAEKHEMECVHHYHAQLLKGGVTYYPYEVFYKEYLASLLWILAWTSVCSAGQFIPGYKWGTDVAEGEVPDTHLRVRALWNVVIQRVWMGAARKDMLSLLKKVAGNDEHEPEFEPPAFNPMLSRDGSEGAPNAFGRSVSHA